MSGKDTERFDGLLLSMAHECKDGGVQEMIDLIFRFVNMSPISVLVYVRTTSKWWKLVFKPNELVYIHDLIRKILFA